jgi:hypothetical protein
MFAVTASVMFAASALLLISFLRIDCIANLMNVKAPTFIDLHSAEVENFKYLFEQYVTGLENIQKNETTGMSFGLGVGFGHEMPSVTLKLTKDGYPVLDDPLPCAKWNKKLWEKFAAGYFSAHYSKFLHVFKIIHSMMVVELATGGKTSPVPYLFITERQKEMVEKQYFPAKFVLRHPSNLQLHEIKSLFEHLIERQRVHGPENTFKFKGFRHGGEISPALYPGSNNMKRPAAKPRKTTARREQPAKNGNGNGHGAANNEGNSIESATPNGNGTGTGNGMTNIAGTSNEDSTPNEMGNGPANNAPRIEMAERSGPANTRPKPRQKRSQQRKECVAQDDLLEENELRRSDRKKKSKNFD